MSDKINELIKSAEKDLFQVRISMDQTRLSIPKGTPVDPKIKSWVLTDLERYLTERKFLGTCQQEALKRIRRVLTGSPPALSEDVEILVATAPAPSQKGFIEWLNPPVLPPDLAQRHKPLCKIHPSVPAQPGLSVYGFELAPPEGIDEPEFLVELPPELVADDEGVVTAQADGQVKFEGGTKLVFSPTYFATEQLVLDHKKMVFGCSVHVQGDLAPGTHWKILGNFTVTGHWGSGDIEVLGDAVAQNGIQTNLEGTIKVYGNLRANYIQVSRIGVMKNVRVESSILQSEIRLGGDLECRGSPGAVLGSSVDCYGIVSINSAGGEKGRPTTIKLRNKEESRVSKIGLLASGTRMEHGGRSWTQEQSSPWETKGGS